MLKATIRLYLTLSFLASFGMSFISSNYVIFLQSNGLNLFEVNLVNLVFYATIFLCLDFVRKYSGNRRDFAF